MADCGSEDDTPSVLQRFASGSPVRIRPIITANTCIASARNQAASASEGRILLFLADDELASPRLVENHARAHEVSSAARCLMGTVNRHPQLPTETVTRQYFRKIYDPHGSQDSIHYTDWTASNASLPITLFDAYGGYSDDAQFLHLEHLEMAYRMTISGVEGSRVDDARSYIWQPAQLDEERYRAYQEGFSLYHLSENTGDRTIFQRFRLRRAPAQRFLSRFLVPFYVRTCHQQEKENRLFVGTLYRRILHHERSCGFEDAGNARPRRPPGEEQAPSAQPGDIHYI